MLEKIKILLEIKDTLQDNVLNLLLENTKTQLLNIIKEQEIPEALEYIILEYTVYRFRLQGSEATESENILGNSSKVIHLSLLEKYNTEINQYLNSKNEEGKKGVFSTFF